MHFTFARYLFSYISRLINSFPSKELLKIPSASVEIKAVPSSLPIPHRLKVNFLPPYHPGQIPLGSLPLPHRHRTLILIILADACPTEVGLFPCGRFRWEKVLDNQIVNVKAWTQLFSISIHFSTCHRSFHTAINVCGTLLL